MQKGIVMRSTGSWYEVQTEEKDIINCRLKGKFKIQGLKTNNPLAVGDKVEFITEGEELGMGVINKIELRENYIIRKSVHKTGHGHILAANVDQLVLIVTFAFPKTSLGFIDRFLVTAEAFRIPVKIIFNKADLLNDAETEEVNDLMDMYDSLGYSCMYTSAINNFGIDDFKRLLADKKSLLAGHSGVGKSTLMNAIYPILAITTREVSTFANKGVHTTTFATMYEVEDNCYIIDSPGIKELGLMDIDESELSHYFPEMRDLLNQCKYHNCKHIAEPKCAVIAGLDNGSIAVSRYKSYLSMIEGDDNRR